MGWNYSWTQCCVNPLMFLCTFLPCGVCCMQTYNAKLTSNKTRAPYVACACSVFLGCIGSAFNRYWLTQHLGTGGSPLYDCLLSFFCICCAVNQEWLETMDIKKGNPKLTICNVKDAENRA